MMSPPLAAGPSGSIAVTRSAPLAALGDSVIPIPVCGGIFAVVCAWAGCSLAMAVPRRRRPVYAACAMPTVWACVSAALAVYQVMCERLPLPRF